MNLYQHDGPREYRFVLKGELSETSAQELEWAWQTAQSILKDKTVIVEVSEITTADSAASDLLFRMRESGAHIIAPRPPQCEELVRLLGLSRVAAGAPNRYPRATTVKEWRAVLSRRAP